MNGLLLSDDLIFSSRITVTARAHNRTVLVCKTVDQLLAKLTGSGSVNVILDLNNPTLDIATIFPVLQSAAVGKIVAYCSHVDAERIKAAKEAGCNLVLARSQFVAKLETDLATWLDTTSSATPVGPA